MQSKCKAMQSNFIRLVFVLILSNYLIINKAVVSFRYAVFKCKFLPASRRDPKTRKSTQDFASGVQVVWADPEDEEE